METYLVCWYLFTLTFIHANVPDATKFVVYGWGIEIPTLVLPCRYFYIQAVDDGGKNISIDLGDDYIKVKMGGLQHNKNHCEVRAEILNYHHGLYMVRYRVFHPCTQFGIELTTKYGDVISGESMSFDGGNQYAIIPDECFCPTGMQSDLDVWLEDMECDLVNHQINQDFLPWSSFVPPSMIEQIYNRYFEQHNHLLCFYRIQNNEVFRNCSGCFNELSTYVDSMLLSLTRKIRLPDVEFFFNLADKPISLKRKGTIPLPIFSWSGSSETYDIVVPSYEMTSTSLQILGKKQVTCSERKTNDIQEVEGMKSILWLQKSNKAFWRGGDASQFRLNLIHLSHQYPQYIDARFNSFYRNRNNVTALRKYGPIVDTIPFEDFFKHKYLITLDGVSAAYRFPFLLAGSSVILKQESHFYEHFYADIKPFVHYVPLNRDLSDLVKKVKWLRSHEDEAKQIIKNSNSYVREHLQPRNVFCYYASVLQKYSAVFGDTITNMPLNLVQQPDQNECICNTGKSFK